MRKHIAEAVGLFTLPPDAQKRKDKDQKLVDQQLMNQNKDFFRGVEAEQDVEMTGLDKEGLAIR
jgi:hypothetical protein